MFAESIVREAKMQFWLTLGPANVCGEHCEGS